MKLSFMVWAIGLTIVLAACDRPQSEATPVAAGDGSIRIGDLTYRTECIEGTLYHLSLVRVPSPPVVIDYWVLGPPAYRGSEGHPRSCEVKK